MIKLIMLIIISISTAQAQVSMEERVGIDPVLRGVWSIVADLNQTENGFLPEAEREEILCKPTSLVFSGGHTVSMLRVYIMAHPTDGTPMNVLFMDNDIMIVVDQSESDMKYFSLQSFTQDAEGKWKEVAHYLIEVLK